MKLTKDYDVVRCGSGIAILFYEEPAESETSYMLSKFEKQIIEHIPDRFIYMARDEDGALYVYDMKPDRDYYKDGAWCHGGFNERLPLKDVFGFVKWEDETAWQFRYEVGKQ